MIKIQHNRDRSASCGLFVFDITQEVVSQLLADALSRGGDYADLFFEYMNVTGNLVSLWNGFLAAGSDPRRCAKWQIPCLMFGDVDFNGI